MYEDSDEEDQVKSFEDDENVEQMDTNEEDDENEISSELWQVFYILVYFMALSHIFLKK